jgi:hypothetical protein
MPLDELVRMVPFPKGALGGLLSTQHAVWGTRIYSQRRWRDGMSWFSSWWHDYVFVPVADDNHALSESLSNRYGIGIQWGMPINAA